MLDAIVVAGRPVGRQTLRYARDPSDDEESTASFEQQFDRRVNRSFLSFREQTQSALVVDDDQDLLAEILEALGNAGISARGATGGPEAMHLLNDGCHPAVVLADLALPGYGGLEVVEAIRKSTDTRTPFIVLSGRVTLDEVLKAVRMGVWDILVKPLRPSSLVESCRAAILGSSVRRAPTHDAQDVRVAKALLATMSDDLSDLPRELTDPVNLKIMLQLYVQAPSQPPVALKYLVPWAGSNSTASRRIDELANAGLIEKSSCPIDHRRSDIKISPVGVEIVLRYLTAVRARLASEVSG
jgi:DNA-binding response OmpR family regulator